MEAFGRALDVDPLHCVVGAHGFLGTALRRTLAGQAVRVRSVVRKGTGEGSSGEPGRTLTGAEVVYWVAGSVNPATADGNPNLVAADLDAVRDFASAVSASDVRRVVLASSGGTVYDVSAAPPYSECSATAPVSSYGRFKLRQEQILGELLPAHVELVTLRIGNAFGPGQPLGTGQGVIAYWLDAALHGRPLTLFGDQTTTRDFTFIDDVAAALAHFGSVAVEGARSVYNISSGEPTELGHLAETIMRVVGEPALRMNARPGRAFDVPHMWLDVSAAAAAGWKATIPLSEGVERSWHSLVATRTRSLPTGTPAG